MNKVEFAFVPFTHAIFGTLFRPRSLLKLSNGNHSIIVDFLIDSGAEVTLVPYWIGRDLGLKAKLDEIVYTPGGVAIGIPVLYRKIKIKIGDYGFHCRRAWSLSDKVSAVLGRLDIFDAFHIEFKQDAHKTIFTKI